MHKKPHRPKYNHRMPIKQETPSLITAATGGSEPLVLYHGTGGGDSPKPIKRFSWASAKAHRANYGGQPAQQHFQTDIGFHFSLDATTARRFADGARNGMPSPRWANGIVCKYHLRARHIHILASDSIFYNLGVVIKLLTASTPDNPKIRKPKSAAPVILPPAVKAALPIAEPLPWIVKKLVREGCPWNAMRALRKTLTRRGIIALAYPNEVEGGNPPVSICVLEPSAIIPAGVVE